MLGRVKYVVDCGTISYLNEPNDNFATSPCLSAAYILSHLQDICLLLLIAHSVEHCEEDNSLQHVKIMSE